MPGSSVSPEESRSQRSFTRYVILLTAPSAERASDELIRAHVTHLKTLDEQGRLVLCGPFTDAPGGMIIIKADSLEQARAIAEADPFVASGARSYELRVLELSCAENNHMGYG